MVDEVMGLFLSPSESDIPDQLNAVSGWGNIISVNTNRKTIVGFTKEGRIK